MRRTTFGTIAVTVAVVSGCGSSAKFANKPRPATPVDLTVYVNDARVSVSPARVGAGEVIFIVTNQADKAESVTVNNTGGALASTGPIQPQGTAQVTVNLAQPGDYVVATAPSGQTQAELATTARIAPAAVHVGSPRPSSSNTLLQP